MPKIANTEGGVAPQPSRRFAARRATSATAPHDETLASAVEREVHQLDPDQAVANVRSMDAVVDGAFAGARFNTVLLGVFAVIAFTLAAVGISRLRVRCHAEARRESGTRFELLIEKRLVRVEGDLFAGDEQVTNVRHDLERIAIRHDKSRGFPRFQRS